MAPARRRALRVLSCCSIALLVAAKARATDPGTPRLTWYGNGCFLFETPAGTRVVMDPTPMHPSPSASLALSPEIPNVDIVTISHEHANHNHIARTAGKPRVLRGLTADRKGWMKIDETIKDVSVRTIGVYRDEVRGRDHGLNTIFVLEAGGLRIVHLGDLGHMLDHRTLSQLGSVDVVLVPIGGETTLNAARAARVVDQIRPRLLVIPMSYQPTNGSPAQTDPLSVFIEGRPHVRRVNGASIAIKVVKNRPGAEIVILDPQ